MICLKKENIVRFTNSTLYDVTNAIKKACSHQGAAGLPVIEGYDSGLIQKLKSYDGKRITGIVLWGEREDDDKDVDLEIGNDAIELYEPVILHSGARVLAGALGQELSSGGLYLVSTNYLGGTYNVTIAKLDKSKAFLIRPKGIVIDVVQK